MGLFPRRMSFGNTFTFYRFSAPLSYRKLLKIAKSLSLIVLTDLGTPAPPVSRQIAPSVAHGLSQ